MTNFDVALIVTGLSLHWSALIVSVEKPQQLNARVSVLFKEVLAIHRQKPELNHGIKASRELLVFL